MRSRIWLLGLVITADLGWGQAPAPDSTSQIKIQFALGQHLAQDIDQTDGRIVNPAMLGYVQGITNRLTSAARGKSMEVRITRGSQVYAKLLPNGVLYISGTLFERLENEAELAGLLAHQIAHLRRGTLIPSPVPGTIPAFWPACVLGMPMAPFRFGPERRDLERESTRDAIEILTAAGYDPSAVPDLLSKLAFEHPGWGKAIVAEDLLDLRAMVEGRVENPAGYLWDSSQFIRQHSSVEAELGHTAKPAPVFGSPR